jgi:hypothetical protein
MTALNPPAIPRHQPIANKGRAFVGLQPEVGIDHRYRRGKIANMSIYFAAHCFLWVQKSDKGGRHSFKFFLHK